MVTTRIKTGLLSLSLTVHRLIVPPKLRVTDDLRKRWDTGEHKIWRVSFFVCTHVVSRGILRRCLTVTSLPVCSNPRTSSGSPVVCVF